jgi:exosortase/archaeosortase family protein
MNKILKMGFCLLLFQIIIILIKPYTHPLQVFLTDFVANIFEFDHSKIEIFVNEYILEIEPLCTGILMYFTLISLFFAFFSFKRALIYSILFIPVVFILNLIRIILTCIIIQKFGYVGVIFHDVYWISDGIFTFILFYIVYKINEKINAK